MKFLHAADIHLDSPLAGLRSRDDLPEDVIRHCTRRAFAAMIDLARAEDVAFVVIAGDLYDGDWKDFSSGLFFAEQMQRLGRPCFLLRGNHDARSVITRSLRLPPNVQEFSSRTCETFQLPELGVALHGHSFPNRAVPEDLSESYRERVPGMLNIGVLHTSARGPGRTRNLCPMPRLGAGPEGLRLLGARPHPRPPRVVRTAVDRVPRQSARPAPEGDRAEGLHTGRRGGRQSGFSGTPVCRRITLGRFGRGRQRGRRRQPHRTDRGARRVAVDQSDRRPVLARLTLTGTTGLHATLLNDADHLAAECRNAAIEADGALWVELVRVRTRPPQQPSTDTLTPLRAAFAAGLDDPELIAALLEEFAALRQKLPAQARTELELPEDAEALRGFAEDAWQIAADALATAETE